MANDRKTAANYIERKKAAIYGKYEMWQNRVARLLVILLLCIHPLFLNTERYIRLTLHKFQFFCACMIVVLLFVIIIWAIRLTRKPKILSQESPTLADWAVIGFAIVTLLSALLSPFKADVNVWIGIPEPNGRYDGAVTQLSYAAIFLIISHWYRPRVRDFAVFGISASLVGLIGILQFYGMDFLKLWPNYLSAYEVNNFYNIFFRSTLGNVDIVSTYVCIAILLCGFLFVRMKSKWQPLWLAASALNFWLMDLADADSGRVGVLVAVVLAIPFIVENRKSFGRTLILGASWLAVYTLQNLFYDALVVNARTVGSLLPYAGAVVVLLALGILVSGVRGLSRTRGQGSGIRSRGPRWLDGEQGAGSRAGWLLGVILIVVIIVAGLAGVEVLGKRSAESANPGGIIYEVREVLHGRIADEMGTNRVYIWRNAFKVYPDHPLIGSGPDTFKQVFPEEAQNRYGQIYDKAHSEYIQLLVCQGILGLICYLIFLVSASLKAVPKAFKNPLVMAVLAAFIGYVAQAFFNISLPIASQMLWVFAGMLANKRFRDAAVQDLA